jgi:uncharacterized protein (TIGR02466 family)
MIKHPVFPTIFYEFDLSDCLDQIRELIPLEPNMLSPHYPGLTQTQHQALHTLDQWQWLKNRVEDCLLEIQKTDEYDPMFGQLRLTRLWANIAVKGSGAHHTQHRHPMSLLSGIIYVTNGEPTKFLDPCYARSLSQIEVPMRANYDDLLIEPQPGKMIVFPSYMQHLTIPHYASDDHRITMAWNSLPEIMVP